ncbi:hypothetical protein FOA52_002196 [Chlamydomonas sp. UWO 241]|nr:hypothetical protein FOA52_002196 [Chlamydomonas sp. UWO 241]
MLGHGGLALGSDMPEGMFSLLPAPRQVTRLEVNYDRVAKVVDVKALKETLHSSITARLEEAGAGGKALQLPFQDLITGLQERGGDEGPDKFKDASVHLCFICLLHLANDHGMSLTNHGQLDSLSVVPLLR